MSHIPDGERTYLKDRDVYARKQRTFLGIQNSAVVLSDEDQMLGYAGDTAKAELVNPINSEDGFGTVVSIPSDFRTAGIAALTAAGYPTEVQANMFAQFMALPKATREVYIAQYDAAKIDPTNLANFVSAMVAMFNK